ncbi:MAG: MBL fold metallo-hydrolase [Fidelibacterota bacterium]|nr:MAG: MBL fold metallo-hydrolase [Candidatus Neomarinimicrobiota bacterium]
MKQLFVRIVCSMLALLFALNCAGMGYRVEPDPGRSPGSVNVMDPEAVHVQYLGTSGFLIYRGGHGLLTAPLYSNPHIFKVGFGRITPDTVRINRLYPDQQDVKIEAILVGHAHYDHLLDVPYVALRHVPEAVIYGNASVARIVSAADSSLIGRMKVLEKQLSREGRPGSWFYLADSTIRFMAIESDHGPHALGIHVMQGEVRTGFKRLPRSAWAWREGMTIAYLIDFLGPDGQTDFRIHYQDATSHYPLGAPPSLAPPEIHRLDLAIVAVGSWFQLPDYPGKLLRNHQPRNIILAHWEGFFRSPLKAPKPIPYSARLRSFIPYIEENLPEDADWLLPRPGAVYTFLPAR